MPWAKEPGQTAPGVVSSGWLAGTLLHAGQPCERFADDGADAGKAWLFGADDTLTEIRDQHVADWSSASSTSW